MASVTVTNNKVYICIAVQNLQAIKLSVCQIGQLENLQILLQNV